MGKTCVKSFVKRGQEVKKENLKAGGIYAVRYVLPAEVAAKYGTVQEQWGLVQLNGEGVIMRTWNVDEYNVMSDTDKHEAWVESLTYFRSSQMERQFVEYYDRWLMDHVKFSLRIEKVEREFLSFQSMMSRILRHPLHRLAEWLIGLFSFRK